MDANSQTEIFETKLRGLYIDKLLTDEQIADELNCSVQLICEYRKKFGIDEISQADRNSRLIKITERQEDILRGSLLGDANLTAEGEFYIQHGPKQFGYLTWLFSNLQPYFGEIRNVRTCRHIRSCVHGFGRSLREEYYPDGSKIVTREILNKLSALSLAVWFMDDGRVMPSGKRSRISTSNFSFQEHEIMCEYFEQVWSIKASIEKNGKSHQLMFDEKNTQRLMSLIRIHIPTGMRYKIRPAVNLSLYLSGGMEYKKNLGTGWRSWLTERLAEQGIDVIDPVKIEPSSADGIPIQTRLTELKKRGCWDEVRKVVREILFRKDMFAIQLVDAVIVLYDESAQRGAGTLSEAWESFREGRPIYLVTDFPLEKIPTWLIGETTAIFNDFEEMLTYTKDHTTIIRDIIEAQKIRDQTLSGIY